MGILAKIPSVFAHRGGWGAAHQNTLRNFDDAARAGAHLEYDLRRTLDGVIVVHHDARVGSRTILGREFGGIDIAKTRYADLPTLEGGTRIPTAREVLQFGRDRGRAQLVETKASGFEREFLDLVDEVGVARDTIFMQSFIPDSVRAIKQLRPDVAAGLLSGRARGHHPGMQSIGVATRIGADYVLPQARYATNAYLDAATGAGLGVVPWSRWKDADAGRVVQLLQDPRVASVIANQREQAVTAARTWRPGSLG